MATTLQFQGMHNARDLGGTPVSGGGSVKQGALYRSDQLFSATAGDIAAIRDLGLGAVIDLRSAEERAEKPDPEIDGVQNIGIPIVQDVRAGVTRDSKSKAVMMSLLARGGDGLEGFVLSYMSNLYKGFVADEFSTAQYSRFVDEVIAFADQGKAVWWHCTGGKDRAGFATAIVLSALGANWDDVVVDYLRTNECLAAVADQLLASVGKVLPVGDNQAAARRFFVADIEYLETARRTAIDLYGSFDGFLEEGLGITAAKRSRMRELLVDAG